MPGPLIHLQIDDPFVPSVPAERLHAVAEHTLHQAGVTDGELTIVVTDDETVQALNYQYRGLDEPTDVLSFADPEAAADFVLPDQEETYWGDVVIAYPTAARQALARGHTPLEEVLLLAVHGTLHLLGHDHGTDAEKARMWAEQAAILARHGLEHVQPPDEEK